MCPTCGADGISDVHAEGSYKRQRMQPEYPQPSPYGYYSYGAGGGYQQGTLSGSTGGIYCGAGGDYQKGTLSGSTGGGPGNAFPVVRLHGLPFNGTESDVYDFFAGLDIVDVLLVKKQGRFSGDAFVVFTGPHQAYVALQKNRQNMGHRYIEVFHSVKPEYYRAIAKVISWEDQPTRRRDQSTGSSLKDNNDNSRHQDDRNNDKDDVEHTGVLKMRGLPFSVSNKDIIDFFGDYNLSEESVHIVHRSDGKATGAAFVEFESAEDSRAAMIKDKMMIGSRYVDLFPSTENAKARAERNSGR